METILSTRQLDVGYDKKVVVRGVDVQALKGQTVCLIGPNGAGKSTILRTLAGMLAPVNGSVYIGREDIREINPVDKAKKLAVVLTEKLNLNMTTVYEVVAMGRTPHTGFFGTLSDTDKTVVEKCLKTVGAWELRDRDYVRLSDGEKQKVLIARALAQEPELLVLDEPTSHLDIRHKIEVIRILNRLALENGLTVILSLHDIDLAMKFCQIILMIKDGKVMAQGCPEDIVGRDTVSELYDIDGAYFDSVLGSVEICNKAEPLVFVTAGAGTGIPIYRMISRMGLGIATGILAENDIDYSVAAAMKLKVVSAEAFEPFGEEQRKEAVHWIDKCKVLIDAGFPVGSMNASNIHILRDAVERGYRLLALRSKEECEKLYGEKENIQCIASLSELTEKLLTGISR